MVACLRVACACLVVVGCGGPKSGPAEPTAKPAAEALVIVDAGDPDVAVPVQDGGDGGDGGAGAPSPLTALAGAPGNVGALALDDEWVYWIDGVHGLARTSKRGGGAVSSLKAMGAGPACCGVLAVDEASVYWAIGSGAAPNGLWRASKAPVPAESTPEVAIDPASPGCLAADAEALYWLRLKRSDDWAGGGSVVRAPKRGGAQKILGSIETPSFGCIAVDASNLYLAAVSERRRAGAIRSVPKTGGPPKTLASVVGPAGLLQVDDAQVYWVDAGGIVRARKTGGARSIVTERPRRCTAVAGIALDGAEVYFSCEGFGPTEDSGTVWRVAKRGGAPVLLAEGQIHPAGIAVDHDFVYWSSTGSRSKGFADGSIARLAKPASAPASE